MDQGGNLAGTVGVGGDLTLGTIDDVDVDFGDDAYVPNEGFTGVEDTLNAVAFGLSTGGPICPVLPIRICRSALKTSLQIKDKSPDTGDLVVFRWTKGDSTMQAELGVPATGATYRLCVYDATGLVRSATAPAGGLCAGQPCWRQLGSATTPNGFKYSDRQLTPTGTRSVTLKSGTSPKPKAIWKAKGDALGDSSLGLVPPVVVEVGNSETSVCFGGTYGGTDVLSTIRSNSRRRRSDNPGRRGCTLVSAGTRVVPDVAPRQPLAPAACLMCRRQARRSTCSLVDSPRLQYQYG
jgi:hypothetical protein